MGLQKFYRGPKLLNGLLISWLLSIMILFHQQYSHVVEALPKKGTVLILARTRNYQDGPLAGSYVISLEVSKKLSKNGMLWALYGGNGKICRLQKITRYARRVLYTCSEEGTYTAFFKPTPQIAFELDNHSSFAGNPESNDFKILTKAMVPETAELAIYEGMLKNEDFFYSDPFTVVDNAYCYRWAYRLEEINAVGFIHTEANPQGSAGSFRILELKVWIMEPAAAILNEVYWDKPKLSQSDYSRLITNRFKSLGITPCLREVHQALEVTDEPEFTESMGIDEKSEPFVAKHWVFRLKLYLDRMVATLSDVTFTIKSRQLSGLYGCFVADVRVFVKSKQMSFLQHPKFRKEKINLNNSHFPPLMKQLIQNNVTHLLGNKVIYTGPSWFRGDDESTNRSYTIIYPNPCISQELVITFRGFAYVTDDWLITQELSSIILPGVLEEEMLIELDADAPLNTSIFNLEISKNSYNNPFKVSGFAFTPTHLVVLREDSILILHPSDLDFKGIGVNYNLQKFRIDMLIRRKWCEYSATPKIQNMFIPAFSRTGNVIVIYIIPLEEKLAISDMRVSKECARPIDTTKSGEREVRAAALSEEEIHANDPKIEIEASLIHRSRIEEEMLAKSKLEPSVKKEVKLDEPDFWLFEEKSSEFIYKLKKQDEHFVQGESDPSNVYINFTGSEYNRNVIFILDKDFMAVRKSFEIKGGLVFTVPSLLCTPETVTYDSCIVREAENYELFALHALEFSAVEKRFFAAVEFQSKEFERQDYNDMSVVVAHYEAEELSPERVSTESNVDELDLTDDLEIPFAGCILYKSNFEDHGSVYESTLNDFSDPFLPYFSVKVQSEKVENIRMPNPLQKRTAILSTINSAFPFYILKLGDVIVIGTTECGFARPLTYFPITNPSIEQPNVTATPRLNSSNYDLLVTKEGLVSVLFYPKSLQDKEEQKLLIGSVLSNEPLRLVRTFIVEKSSNYFQVSTPEGEIVYGRSRIDHNKLAPAPETRFLEVPFWSLLRGSIMQSLGDNPFPLQTETSPSSTTSATSTSMICSFSSFDVQYFKRNYAEVGYRIRVTAEVTYYGDVVPLDADLLVEKNDLEGISVSVKPCVHVEDDLTLIRKTIDISVSMPESIRKEMFERHLEHRDGEPFTDRVRVFTLTLRPSLLNLHCERASYFETIQINIGCAPDKSHAMRLLAENLPLSKQEINELTDTVDLEKLKVEWFWNKTGDFITAPRDRVSFKQRALFGCESDDVPFCKIPHAKLLGGNIYTLSHRDTLVPVFENFLTSHVRPVTGNVIIYDVLESWKDGVQMTVNTTQWDARCIVDGENWYANLSNFASKGIEECDPIVRKHGCNKLHTHADIYGLYFNCFSTTPSARSKDQTERHPLRSRDLARRPYYVFNRTNFNALRLNRTRNYLYIFRAVVLNTERNQFTFCQVMDTYFALRVGRMSAQREPLTWYIYLGIIFSILAILLCSYIYFYRTYSWKTELERGKARMVEEMEHNLEQEEMEQPKNAFKKLAERARVLARWKLLKKEDATPALLKKVTRPLAKPLPSPTPSKYGVKAGPSGSSVAKSAKSGPKS